MELTLFNTLSLSLFNKCLVGVRFDTSRAKFSFDAKIIPFYTFDFWNHSFDKYEKRYKAWEKNTDLLIPFLLDLKLIVKK